MRRFARLLPFTAVVVVMTACGGPATTPAAKSQPAVFPVTISRIGGIAGFRDVVVVTSDGLVSVAGKGQAPWQCRLTPQAAVRLTEAASTVPWPRLTPASTQPSFPDALVTTVRSPAGGPVRLEDPQTGAAGKVFADLLSDLRGGRSRSGTCRPV